MKIGITFPHDIDPAAIPAFGRDIEAAGFDYLCSLDHVAGAHPDRLAGIYANTYTYVTPTHEVFTLYSYLAATTQRIGFVTSALILPQRQTVLVAKQTAELQVLSGGRLRLGTVIGWNEPESEAMGADFHSRGSRIEEQIEVLRLLWSQPLVTFEGRFHHLDRVGINPLPPVAPQVWIGGGYEDRLLRRVARLADGWMPGQTPTGDLGEAWGRLKRHVADSGRDPATFGLEVRLNMNRVPRERWLAQVEEWRNLGATHLAFLPPGQLPVPQQLEMSYEARELFIKAGFA